MQESDWDVFLERLVTESKRAISSFASEHPTEEVCHFAFDSEPSYGYVLTSFNMTRVSLAKVRERHDHDARYLLDLLQHPKSRDEAYYYVRSHSLLPFCNNPGDFAYQQHAEVQLPEWRTFFESPDYVDPDDPDKDYLANRVARLFCRAIDQLVRDNAFASLRLASPTLLGFAFHDHEPHVLQILNFPDAAT
jgi:hypothetical protein